MRGKLIAAVLLAASACVRAADYPDVYLRGNFENTNWGVTERYKFSHDGPVYTLKITSDNPVGPGSHFKIATEDWQTVDFGGEADDVKIDWSQNIQLARTGRNLTTDRGFSEATITFTYTDNASSMLVDFDIPGTKRPPVAGLSGTLPVLYINVYADEAHSGFNNEVISRDLSHKNYFEFADYWLDTNGCTWLEELGAENVGSEEAPLPLQIKARGNWTRWGFSKKPFKIKLDKKQTLLGLSKSKHFALLAHADDQKGYLRNFVGFELGKRIGLPWTPSQQPVEVVINGNYRGLYFLTESIRAEEGRVAIAELNDLEEDSSLVSGGYIVELDNYDEDDSSQIRMEERHCAQGHHNYDALRVTFDTPEEYSYLQRLFVSEQFTSINNLVGSNDDSLWSYLDLDDAARYYLVEEIMSHTESYHGSTYLHRDRGEGQKWHFSPLWDFGQAFNGSTDDFFYNCDPYGNTWIPSIRENYRFNDKVRRTWLWFMSACYPGIEEVIAEFCSRVSAAAKADYARWKDEPVPGGGQPVADNRDMESRRNEVVNHLRAKTAWLKSRFGDYTAAVFAEPERDDTPAAPLPSYITTNIDDIPEAGEDDGGMAFYTLQGIRVETPLPGTLCIMVKGGRASKILVGY